MVSLVSEEKEETRKRLLEEVRQQSQRELEMRESQAFGSREEYSKCLQMHLACLKTEFIFNQIFTPIEAHNLLNLEERESIELIHLLLSRCFKNMSPLKEELKRHGQDIHKAFRSLDVQIEFLYPRVKSKFEEFDAKLQGK